jgi:tetratricopeptide (TPR) repeat protein
MLRALLPALALLGCGVLEPRVARQVDGVTREGRFIEPRAYALYAMAAVHEARAEWAQALELYRQALEADPRGPEIRTRIGAVACRVPGRGFAKLSADALREALEEDAEYAPAWFELASCLRRQRRLEQALLAAREALRLDPERHRTSLLFADLLEERGDAAAAWRVRDALATHARHSIEVQRALADAARRGRMPARLLRAESALRELTLAPLATHASSLALALEALRQGKLGRARELAKLLLENDTSNGDALIVALVTADLAQDQAEFSRLLESAQHGGAPASPATLKLLAELVSRRVSASAAALLSTTQH